MSNFSRGPGQPAEPAPPEPSVRRWPHPVDGFAASRQQGPALHYICSALSYQNQTLADIKALLQQLVVDREVPGPQAKDGEK